MLMLASFDLCDYFLLCLTVFRMPSKLSNRFLFFLLRFFFIFHSLKENEISLHSWRFSEFFFYVQFSFLQKFWFDFESKIENEKKLISVRFLLMYIPSCQAFCFRYYYLSLSMIFFFTICLLFKLILFKLISPNEANKTEFDAITLANNSFSLALSKRKTKIKTLLFIMYVS